MRDFFRLLFMRKGDILGSEYVRDGVDWISVSSFVIVTFLFRYFLAVVLPDVPLWLFWLAVGITFLVALVLGDFWHYSKKVDD